MKKSLIILILIFSLISFMGLKLHLDNQFREKVPGSSIIYIPTGRYLKFATLGYSSLAADIIYLWAIQYYSTTEITNRFDYLEHIFTIITELDPKYLDPYEIGAIIAVYEAGNFDLAFKILDKGLENNPDEWLFPYEAGHYAQRLLKDYELAREYYRKAMAIPGAPAQTRRLFANALFETMDYQKSWETWLEIYQTAQDERTKKIASNHLYRVKAAVDTDNLARAAAQYKNRYGRYPETLDRLAAAGLVAEIPKDLDGKDYVYDPGTGEVKSPTIPWKR
jgi:tetratricopeptide (TPR) repeat protein